MKKIYLTCILLTAACNCFAQFRLGVKAGVNYNDLLSEFEEYEPKPGFQAGIATEIPFGRTFFLRPELLYSQKGYIYQTSPLLFPPGVIPYDFHYKLHYINLPVMAGIRPFKQLSLLIGPEIGYRVGLSGNALFGTGNYKDFDAGLSAGACVYILPSLALDARYIHGITKVYEITPQLGPYFSFYNNNAPFIIIRHGQHQTLQVSLNYFFLK